MDVEERRQVFGRLRSFDEKKPGSLLWEMIQIDQQRGCEYMTVLLEKKESRAIARGAQSLCTRF